MQAQIVWSQSKPTHVLALMNGEGEIIDHTCSIVSNFQSYYQDLYTSRADYTLAELSAYLAIVNLAVLSMEERETLMLHLHYKNYKVRWLVFLTPKLQGLMVFLLRSIKTIMTGCFQSFLIH